MNTNSNLSQGRIEHLEEIGFQWQGVDHDDAFEKRCRDLIAFNEEHGHCNVPKTHANNPSLGHTDKFLQNNNLLELIVRAHLNHKLASYETSHEGRAITIHWAPDFNEEESETHYGEIMNVNSADRDMHSVHFKLLEDQ